MNLTLRERLFLASKALTGGWDLKPGSAGERLLRGIFPAAVGAPPTRGTQAQLQGYSSMPWVRAVAGRVGYAVSAVPWRLYVTKQKPSKLIQSPRAYQRKDIQFAGSLQVRKDLLGKVRDMGELTEITDHPMLDLLNDGNLMHSGMELRKIAAIHRDLVGEAFWLKERGALNKITSLWPVPPQWIISTPTPGYQQYRVSFRGWQGFIPATEVLWFKDSDPAMPYWRGSGTAQSLSDELETDEYAAKHLKQFFYNHARPDVIISPKGDLQSFGQQEIDRLDQKWTQDHGGFWRAFKPMFSSRPLEVTSFPQNFQHLQLTDLRKSVRDICLQVWGVPPEILGILENSNRATIDSADYLFSKWVIVPRLEAWRLDYQRLLVPEYDSRYILDYESPIQEDTAFRGTIMRDLPWAFTADEVREVAGLSPLDNDLGDFHMEPTTLTRVDSWEEHVPEPQPLVAPGLNANGLPTPAKPKPAAGAKFNPYHVPSGPEGGQFTSGGGGGDSGNSSGDANGKGGHVPGLGHWTDTSNASGHAVSHVGPPMQHGATTVWPIMAYATYRPAGPTGPEKHTGWIAEVHGSTPDIYWQSDKVSSLKAAKEQGVSHWQSKSVKSDQLAAAFGQLTDDQLLKMAVDLANDEVSA